MPDRPDRRTDPARRRRVEQLLARVHRARADILEAGLAAVGRPRERPDPSPRPPGAPDRATDTRT
jgi:hypothetical protein